MLDLDEELEAFIQRGSICNENPFITSSTNALGFYPIYQTKDQSLAVKMVYKTLFYIFIETF